jgi:beta-glucosidase
VAGKEIVQLYVHDVQARLPRPPKELKAFAKVQLEPGETKRVSFTLTERALSYYDPDHQQWVAEAGEFDILIGSSSADIRLTQRITLSEGTPLPPILHMESTVGDWLADPRGAKLLQPLLEAMMAAVGQETLGMEAEGFIRYLPLTVLLGFPDFASQEASPPQIVADLLARLHAEHA